MSNPFGSGAGDDTVDRITPAQLNGHLVIVWAVDYKTGIKLKNFDPKDPALFRDGDAAEVDIVDLEMPGADGQEGHLYRNAWFLQGRLIAKFKRRVGQQPLLGRIYQTGPRSNDPFDWEPLETIPECLERGVAWFARNPEHQVSEPKVYEPPAPQQPQQQGWGQQAQGWGQQQQGWGQPPQQQEYQQPYQAPQQGYQPPQQYQQPQQGYQPPQQPYQAPQQQQAPYQPPAYQQPQQQAQGPVNQFGSAVPQWQQARAQGYQRPGPQGPPQQQGMSVLDQIKAQRDQQLGQVSQGSAPPPPPGYSYNAQGDIQPIDAPF